MSGAGFQNFCAAAMVLPSVDVLSEDDAGHRETENPTPKSKTQKPSTGASSSKPKGKAKPKSSPLKRPAAKAEMTSPMKKPSTSATSTTKRPATSTKVKDEPANDPVKVGMCFYKRNLTYGFKIGNAQVLTVPSLHFQSLIAPMFDSYV